jgi:menaquinol-cytochrome c reductase iron-sulfur subunit
MPHAGVHAEPTPARRTFLSRVILTIQAAIGGAVAYVVGGAALAPSFFPGRQTWLRAAPVTELVEGEPTPVTVRIIKQDGYRQVVERRVVYLRRERDGAIVALDSTCTHLGCRTRYDTARRQFVCPCHGGVYDADGAVVAGPPPAPLMRIEARIDDGHVVVQV